MKEENYLQFLGSGTHLGGTNLDYQLEQYIYKRKISPLRCVDIAIPSNKKGAPEVGPRWWMRGGVGWGPQEVLRMRDTSSREHQREVSVIFTQQRFREGRCWKGCDPGGSSG
ncbi:hypothetical protein J1605_015401 [Eschrichtius robustus]|uniref:Uncharacterized protein n=1 Tax=Eschrichtius robustus TaxID=9764 RepID=A0AB34G9X9_ESCRO|nr:hypothetical protein J1605_015401 [Eschrichtius robustus]